jgi:alpha-galactosidase
MTKTIAKNSLVFAVLFFSASLLGAADVPTNVVATVATPPPAPEILTPKPAATPRINGPKIYGVRPGSPFYYCIPATGDHPMTFSADGLPEGLQLDPANGRIVGLLKFPGEFKVTLHAKNSLGEAEKPFRIVVGEEIQLTPAMGWNSYNCFGERVTQDLALRAARQMVKLGLDQHGWTYINMDDGWQGERSGAFTALQADTRRFTDIKAMVDEIHGMGLKAGLYSSPWVVTYGGKLGGSAENPEGTSQRWSGNAPKNKKVLPFAIGKYRFTYQDAQQFADWGFDYLKLDWGPVEAPETKEMHQASRLTRRDIVLSLSNNHVKNLFRGIGDVSPWAQSWRTITDIRDVWSRVALEKMDDFTLSLLTNDEVLEVNQDTLGKQAVQVGGAGDLKVYAKPLDDGSLAVGLFNTGKETTTVRANWSDLKLKGSQRVRDLWRQKDLGRFTDKFEAPVAPHGVVLVRIFPNP